MNNKLLGSLALVGAPFLCVDMYLHASPDPNQFNTTSLSGLLELIYMLGWQCSIIGLWRLGATGQDRFGRIIVPLIMGTLTLANIWNIYVIILPNHNTLLYHILDLFWPISNLVMIGVGVAVIRAKKLTGWSRYVPLICGLWFPVTTLIGVAGVGAAFDISNIYTATAWSLLAVVILIHKEPSAYTRDLETVSPA